MRVRPPNRCGFHVRRDRRVLYVGKSVLELFWLQADNVAIDRQPSPGMRLRMILLHAFA